jgi:FAD/FMN-containing dehydrogenase
MTELIDDMTPGITPSPNPQAVAELHASLGTNVITPSDAGYEAARRVWNGMIDRRPAAVARCRGAADVIEVVRIARSHGIPLAVRGGGHNVAGFGTCDGGVVADLSPMRGVRVDPKRRTVRAGAGATWADVDRETQPFGLAVPGGIVSTTGIAGLTLGGGQGWLRRTCGMTSDNLLSADVVTADGEFVVASDSENPDLFWALRGGGGNFGVVTSFEYRLHPVGPNVAFAGPVYALRDASRVLPLFRDFCATMPDTINATATVWTLPAAPGFPAELHGAPAIVLGGLYVGDPAEGTTLLEPMRKLGTPMLDLSATLPFTAVQQLFDAFFPSHDLRYYWKSVYVDGLESDVVREILAHAETRPSRQSMIAVWALGGALARVDADATAAGDREAPWLVEVLATWSAPADDDANIAWARGCFEALKRFGSGKSNFNFPGLGEDGEQFVRSAFGANYERLRGVKRSYDPSNLFTLNQNIVP